MSNIARLVTAGIMIAVSAISVAQADSRRGGGDVAGRRDQVVEARRTIRLAERGDARAQALLGFMYANGRGVPQSYEAAVEWYMLAAEQGDSYGQFLLGLMYDKGFGVPQDVILAHKWLNLSAAHSPRQSRDYILRLRNAVASKMTRAQLDIAQQLALDFLPIRR